MGLRKFLKAAANPGGLVGAAVKSGAIGDIARNGGLGLVGMLAAKKHREEDDRADGPGIGRTGVGSDVIAKRKGGKVSVAAAVHKHERNMHKGKPLTKLAKGSSASARADGCATKGKTKGRFV